MPGGLEYPLHDRGAVSSPRIRLEPQAAQVPALVRVFGIGEAAASVGVEVIVEEEDVAGLLLEADEERGIFAGRLEGGDRGSIGLGKPRHVGMPLRAFDIHGQREAGDAFRGPREDWPPVVGQIPRTLFVAPVDVEIGIQQVLQRRRIGFSQPVVDGKRADDRALAADRRLLEEQQGDQVGAVGVHVEGDGRLVSAGRRIVDGLSFVDHVTEQVSAIVLRPGFAKVHAEAPEHRAGLILRIAVYGQALDLEYAQTQVEFPLERGQLAHQQGYGEIFPAELRHDQALGLDLLQGTVQLGDIFGAQVIDPRTRVLEQRFRVPCPGMNDLLDCAHCLSPAACINVRPAPPKTTGATQHPHSPKLERSTSAAQHSRISVHAPAITSPRCRMPTC